MNELLIFAKAPRPGLVKTRLAESLGKEKACRSYERLLQEIARRLAVVKCVTICYSPVGAEEELRPYFPAHWRFRPQQGADLGARLHEAVATSFRQGARSVAAIGSDCPYLSAEDISETWELLEKHDAVFGPAQDGGYWLVGCNRPQAALFRNIDWGTKHVLKQSLARAKSLELKVGLLRELSDIDTALDWQAFVNSRSALSRAEP